VEKFVDKNIQIKYFFFMKILTRHKSIINYYIAQKAISEERIEAA